jgi:peptide/nickel transport system permease protein
MLSALRTWWQESRVVRKFRREHTALVALSIIGVFTGVYIWTALTPLDTDYVNLQERKISEFSENKGSLTALNKKQEALQAAIGKVEGKLKKLMVPPAPKAKAKKPASQPASQPAVTMADVRRVAAVQRKRVAHLQALLGFQRDLAEVQSQRVLLQIKMQQKKPAALSWLQRYNQDTGRAYAQPVWWAANKKERAIIGTLNPYLPFASGWVKSELLSHERRGLLGTDRLGRDIFKRVLVSVNVAFKIGLVTALIACFLGLLFGGIAGFFGGWVDLIITWIYSVFSSIPYIVLVLLIAAVVRAQSEVILPVAAVLGLDPGLIGLYLAFSLTFWIGPARVVRGEVMKIKEMEYVQAARALGNSRMRILFRHVLPNTMHLIFVYFSLIFIGAIKSEVILTFLGLGVKNMPSWGGMISDASKEIIGGIWWQMIGASLALFLLVYAFNIFTDALQDALDPKHIK